MSLRIYMEDDVVHNLVLEVRVSRDLSIDNLNDDYDRLV